MGDKPVEVEKIGIEHVPEDLRHGSPNRTFTLWFAANLTIADYVAGVLTTVFFGFTMAQAIPVLLVGNLLGGLFLGVAAAMGPSLGFPQMLSCDEALPDDPPMKTSKSPMVNTSFGELEEFVRHFRHHGTPVII